MSYEDVRYVIRKLMIHIFDFWEKNFQFSRFGHFWRSVRHAAGQNCQYAKTACGYEKLDVVPKNGQKYNFFNFLENFNSKLSNADFGVFIRYLDQFLHQGKISWFLHFFRENAILMKFGDFAHISKFMLGHYRYKVRISMGKVLFFMIF